MPLSFFMNGMETGCTLEAGAFNAKNHAVGSATVVTRKVYNSSGIPNYLRHLEALSHPEKLVLVRMDSLAMTRAKIAISADIIFELHDPTERER
jgi:hypothetical protein